MSRAKSAQTVLCNKSRQSLLLFVIWPTNFRLARRELSRINAMKDIPASTTKGFRLSRSIMEMAGRKCAHGGTAAAAAAAAASGRTRETGSYCTAVKPPSPGAAWYFLQFMFFMCGNQHGGGNGTAIIMLFLRGAKAFSSGRLSIAHHKRHLHSIDI